MRRTLMLLALLAGGFWGAAAPQSAPVAGDLHEIAPADRIAPAAFARSGIAVLPSVLHEGSGPAPRPVSGAADVPRGHGWLSFRLPPLDAAFAARCAEHLHYAATIALERAGRLSFHTTAPPPFPLI